MCFRVACRDCGKFTWSGCGKHLKTLYASIDQGQHCMCKYWPGVVIPTKDTTQQPATEASTSALPPRLQQEMPKLEMQRSHCTAEGASRINDDIIM